MWSLTRPRCAVIPSAQSLPRPLGYEEDTGVYIQPRVILPHVIVSHLSLYLTSLWGH